MDSMNGKTECKRKSAMSEEKQPIPESPQTFTPVPEEAAIEAASQEKEIDLNILFPDAETDLNSLFPDEEMRHLLKSVSKNRKDLHALQDRFLMENETEDDAKDA